MNENKKEFVHQLGGKEVVLETGRLAKQADGAVLVSCGSTQVLVTVCSAQEAREGQDFFPLAVDYVEKFYSAGKFLGGFIKREAKPTVQETLNARLIDRPIRPLFPKGYMCETIVAATVLSYGPNGDPEIMAGLGASAALSVSDIPWDGPIGFCKVCRINGELVINPDYDLISQADMELVVAASKDAILMVEGEANEASEQEVLDAILFGHENIKDFCAVVSKMQKQVGKKKREFAPVTPNTKLMKKLTADFTKQARRTLEINEKLLRQNAVKTLVGEVALQLEKNPGDYGLAEEADFKKEAFGAVDELLYEMMRADILKEERRITGRKLTQVRPIEVEANVLKKPHGSALFTRGETQVLATVTLGGAQGEQMQDRIVGQKYDHFYLHYNFPPFSVGEAKGKFNVGRRELGHGNLAERALKTVMPKSDDFQYTVRVVCEVLESNGSSSMASVCSGSMALMDAGVPIKSPVAGIAMGLISDGKKYKILTDILGDEDHLGDMDFKVAGTVNGINAIQMDIKIAGINKDILTEALDQAKAGRHHILKEMERAITTNREVLKDGVPLIKTIQIAPDEIGGLIGPGGKNIKKLQENFAVTIECKEDGLIKIIGVDREKIDQCLAAITMQFKGPEINSIYDATVVTIKEYGAFVDLVAGVSGLVHISEIADDRVKNVNEYLSEGDKIQVKVLDIDRMGRIKLSAKAVKPLSKKE